MAKCIYQNSSDVGKYPYPCKFYFVCICKDPEPQPDMFSSATRIPQPDPTSPKMTHVYFITVFSTTNGTFYKNYICLVW